LTPDAKDLFSDRGLAQAAEIAKDQAVYYLFRPVFFLKQIGEYKENFSRIQSMVHGYVRRNRDFFDEAAKQNPSGWSKPEYRVFAIVRDWINPVLRF
jgi:hypothetical protein